MAGRFRLGITAKILIAFLALSLVSLASLGILAYRNMNRIGEYSVENSATALEEQAQNSLLSLARDQAALSNALFEKVAAETEILSDFAASLWANQLQLEDRPSYSSQDPPEDVHDASVYFLSPGTDENAVKGTISLTSYMDDVFKPMYRSDSNLTWTYIGTEDGVFRLYPWFAELPSSFNHKVRPWYSCALNTGSGGWTSCYIDAGGRGLAITRYKPVYSREGILQGVIGVDVTIETINQRIINTQIGERGYALMVDSDGNVIARPGISAGDKQWDESFELDNLLSSEDDDLRQIVEEMVAGKSGIGASQLSGEEKFIAYAPISSTGWSVGVVAPVDEIVAAAHETALYIKSEQWKAQRLFGGIITAVLLVVAGLVFWLARKITKPVLSLAEDAKVIGSGRLDHRVEIKTRDELEDLANSFNKMALDLKNYVEELRRTTAEKERMAKELEIARGIQQNFLPASAPQIEGMELAAFNLPAWEVGGDFYDFIPVSADKWGLVIADVSGKGVPAALFMALSRTLVRANAIGNPTISEAIRRANVLIAEDDRSNMFVTLFYGVLDPERKTLTYINAGHNSPLVLRGSRGDIVMLEAKGIALGIMPHIELEEREVSLREGDIVALYTDGVTEAINNKEEQFGKERLIATIEANRRLSASELIEKIQQEVALFSQGQPQFDDVTLMILKVTQGKNNWGTSGREGKPPV